MSQLFEIPRHFEGNKQVIDLYIVKKFSGLKKNRYFQ